jgi:hypothetical protein
MPDLPWNLLGSLCTDRPTTTAAKKNSLGLPAFLTPEEAAIVLARIEHDRGDAVEAKPSLKLYVQFIKDWKMWEFPLYLILNVCLFSRRIENFGLISARILQSLHLHTSFL